MYMEVNYFVILLVTVVLMVLAMIWFGPLFWNLWMKIHGWENMSKQELKEKDGNVWMLLAIETIGTLVMASVLAFFITQAPGYYELAIAFFIWIWFMLPGTISGVIWGADKKQYQFQKIMILSGFSLVALLIAALIFSIWL